MILRLDRLLIDLPKSKHPSPNSAAAVQQLLGGKFGEMSTLMNYTFQSFNFRGRSKMRPFYDLIAGTISKAGCEPVDNADGLFAHVAETFGSKLLTCNELLTTYCRFVDR